MFKCILTKEHYCGSCKIKQCHANLSSSKHESGCLYLFYDNKKQEFDKYDIMHVYDLKDKTYRSLYNEGLEKTTCLVTLYKLIAYLRDINKKEQCNHCGIFHSVKDNRIRCKNVKACNERRQVLLTVFKQSNLYHSEFRASLKDVYLLIKYRSGVETYLKSIKNSNKANLYELFGLEPHIFESLAKIDTETTA